MKQLILNKAQDCYGVSPCGSLVVFHEKRLGDHHEVPFYIHWYEEGVANIITRGDTLEQAWDSFKEERLRIIQNLQEFDYDVLICEAP